MSLEDLQAATAALTAAADAYTAKIAEIDARIADIPATIRAQMAFTATFDPDVVAEVPGPGGTFRSLQDLVLASPSGAKIICLLPSGREVVLTELVHLNGRHISFRPDAAAEATLSVPTFVEDGDARLYGLRVRNGETVRFMNVRINLAGRPGAEPWNFTARAMIRPAPESFLVSVGLAGCRVFGADDNSLVSSSLGGFAMLNVHNSDFDGAFTVLGQADEGAAVIGAGVYTTANGAALQVGGTVGSNILLTGGV